MYFAPAMLSHWSSQDLCVKVNQTFVQHPLLQTVQLISTVQPCPAQPSAAQHGTARHSRAHHGTAQHSTVMPEAGHSYLAVSSKTLAAAAHDKHAETIISGNTSVDHRGQQIVGSDKKQT